MLSHVISAVVGIWLMASPSLVGTFSDTASANNRIFGPLVVAFSVIALWEVMRSVRFGNTLVGLWLLIASILMGYGGAALMTNIVAALIVIGLSLVRGEHDPLKFGGGWEALWNNKMWDKGQPDL